MIEKKGKKEREQLLNSYFVPSIEHRALLTPGSHFTPMPALYGKLNNRPYT